MPYFHGTQARRIGSILKHGLGGFVPDRNWPDAENGVYVATTPEVCVAVLLDHYLQTGSEGAKPSEVLQSFRVIVIDDSRIDAARLRRDPELAEWTGAYIYDGVIDITGMPVLDIDAVLPSQ